jgi:phosphonate transport system substrate-binding protein
MRTASRLAVLAVLFMLAFSAGGLLAQEAKVQAAVRIGLTPVFLDDQVAFLNVWRDYLARRLNRPVVFVQRGSYRDVVDMLRHDNLDFAWVCGYPYVRYREQMTLLAVPVFKGKPLYQSYLIVPVTDTTTKSLSDLRGKVFAYSDPDSNSGYLYTQFSLHRLNERPAAFFARTFFTWGHRKVVEAVASGLAQGGAADGYVWETLSQSHPELTARTRIVRKSPEFGFPPFVARASIGGGELAAMQAVLIGMNADPEGRALLKRLNLDGFEPGGPALFDGVFGMYRAVSAN